MTEAINNHRLAAARTRIEQTEAAVTAASRALVAAEALLANVDHELAEIAANDREVEAQSAAAVKKAFLSGITPSLDFEESGISRGARVAIRNDAERRHKAAKRAVNELKIEVLTQKKAADEARAELAAAARAILTEEIETHVKMVTELEQEALEHRIKVQGGINSLVFGWGRNLSLSDTAKSIALSNGERTRIPVANTREFRAANQEAQRWREHYAELLDPGAT